VADESAAGMEPENDSEAGEDAEGPEQGVEGCHGIAQQEGGMRERKCDADSLHSSDSAEGNQQKTADPWGPAV